MREAYGDYGYDPYLDIEFPFRYSNLIDLGDCYEVRNVSINLPKVFSTEAEARRVMSQEGYQDVEKVANGYIVSDYGTYYTETVWTGSVFINKDAAVWDFSKSMSIAEALGMTSGRLSPRAVIVSLDNKGHVNALRIREWG